MKKARVNNRRTRAGKAAAPMEYNEANRELKKSVKADRKQYVKDLATEADEAARNVNVKEL